MKKILILTGHGAGDTMQAFQVASFIFDQDVTIALSVRDEVFNFVNYCFGDLYKIKKVDLRYAENNNILHNDNLFYELAEGYDEFYFVIPDLLFNSYKYNFDYKKYNTHPQLIKSRRLLQCKWRPEKRIYINTNTTTDSYHYPYLRDLLIILSNQLNDYEIYYPLISNWNNTHIVQPKLTNLPSNVFIHDNPTIQESLSYLFRSEYGVYTCNGPSHAGFHVHPRLVLDPRFGQFPFISRWKEDYSESIPIHSNPEEVAKIIKLNIRVPQTTLIDRKYLLSIITDEDGWRRILFLKDR